MALKKTEHRDHNGLLIAPATGTDTPVVHQPATGTPVVHQPTTVTPQASAYDPVLGTGQAVAEDQATGKLVATGQSRPKVTRPGIDPATGQPFLTRPRTVIDDDLDLADAQAKAGDPLAEVPDEIEGDDSSRFARDLEEAVTSGKPLKMSLAEAVSMFEPQAKPSVPSIFDTFAVQQPQPKDMGAMSGSHEDDLDEACSTVAMFADELSAEQANKVYLALRQYHTLSLGNYGADFDISQEIGEQLAIAKAMRARLLDEEGRLNERFSAREAKEVMSACSTLIGVLMKSQQELLSFRRVLMVENATKRALDTLPREAQDAYLQELERQLATT